MVYVFPADVWQGVKGQVNGKQGCVSHKTIKATSAPGSMAA